MCLNPTSALVN